MSIRPERNNDQYQPLTTVLRNIIRDYQAGDGVLLELCQNADDAGASKIEFVLDRTQHKTKNILHDGLAEYQGVSLLAYNNSTFAEEDFESLRKIGDSGKADDPGSTGKFGKGFNSVYNWTDSPSIISGSSLLILDPHRSWSASPEVGCPGGPMYDFVKHSHKPEMKNQLSAFSSFLKDPSSEFDGTIIRLPLRTKAQAMKSQIVAGDKDTPEQEVIDVFHTFSGELVKSLLFLKNLNSITLRIDDKVYAKAESEFAKPSLPTDEKLSAKARKRRMKRENTHREKADVNRAYQRVFVDKLDLACKMDFVMNISLQDKDNSIGNERKFRYAISHVLGQGPEDQELQSWASQNKLFPWTAIAAPLEGDPGFKGNLFSTLPLPIHTNHPVHIHGMFSITSDRLRIHSGGDWATSRDSEAKLGTKWNQWLFSECIPHAWVNSLEFLKGMAQQGLYPFSAWKFWPAGSDEEWKERGMRILGDVFERVVANNLRLLPTLCEATEAAQTVLFTLEDVAGLESAIKDAGVAIVVPPKDKKFELERLQTSQHRNERSLFNHLKSLTPSSLRTHLTLNDDTHDLPLNSRMLLLDYIISDGNFREIGLCKAPLIPVTDGTFESFDAPNEAALFLAKDDSELELFTNEKSTVDTSKLLPETFDMMQNYINELRQYSRITIWTTSDAALYCKKHVFKGVGLEDTDIIAKQGINDFVDKLWIWISQNSPAALTPLHDLWLVPLMDGDYQKVGSKSLVLDVSEERWGIAVFLRETAHSKRSLYGTTCTLFTGDTSSLQTKEYLRRCGLIKECHDTVSLMNWLDAVSANFIDRFSTHEKTLLLQYLHELARGCIGKHRTKVMKDTVSRLKIFKEAKNGGTDECNWVSLKKVDLEHYHVKYVGVKGIPVVLRAPNTVFIDIGDNDTMGLVKVLGLASCPALGEILQCYVVPEILNANSGDSRTITLIEYALKNFESLSEQCIKDLSQTKIVPVQGSLGMTINYPREALDPRSAVATLFFLDENRVGDENFCTRFHNELIELGMVSKINDALVYDRIMEYAKGNRTLGSVSEKAQQLITTCQTPPQLPQNLLQLRWIPVKNLNGTDHLSSAGGCRDQKAERLVKYIMPIVQFPVSSAWNSRLGWDQPLPLPTLHKQLEGAVKANDLETMYFLIKRGYILAEEVPKRFNKIAWVPSAAGEFYQPRNIYAEDFTSLSPHFGTLNPRFRELKFFSKIGVQKAPSFQQLKDFQDGLARKETLEKTDLDMAVSIVREVGKRYPKNEDLRHFKAPDRHGRMRVISELTAGDPGGQETDLKIMHPAIPLDTAKQLGLATFRDRYLEFMNDPHYEAEFAQKETPKAIIEDTLKRYSISSTFSEYVANAEDCGSASTVSWILDESDDYSKTRLLSPGLAEFQGPALFCYNDGTFSEKDFNGIIDIGIGSKQNDSSKIGKFGRGALTMYHWTSVPSFISQDYFVIFDPEQKYLPQHPTTKQPRAGMKIKIRDVRAQWPEQLQPFEGIAKFSKESTSFPGTLFRFPLPRLGGNAKISISQARGHLESYYEEANLSLLFLKNITSITFSDKHSKQLNWTVRSKISLKVENSQISHITITGKYPRPFRKHEQSDSISRNWCIITGEQDDIPEPLFKLRLKKRLEAKYSLAALLSEKAAGSCSGYFVGLPLQVSEGLELPVFINADIILHRNRRSIPLIPKEEGSKWNRWIFEKCVPPLYLDMVQYLMQLTGRNGYSYWPRYQPRSPETVSKIVSTAFWSMILCSKYNLYPPNPLPASDTEVQNVLSLYEATFDLLDTSTQSEFLRALLLRLGLRTIVTPNETVRNGLKDIRPPSMESITPEFLLSLFRAAPAYSDELLEIWGQEQRYSISYFDQLLSFITIEPSFDFSLLIDCALLPLANDTLGIFLPNTTPRKYLVAETADERKILGIAGDIMVHHCLGISIAKRLISCGLLNVRQFEFDDIIELHPRLDQEKKSIGYKKEWLASVWSYLKTASQRSIMIENTRLERLQDMEMYYGKVVGGSQNVFLCPSEFNIFLRPAILEPSGSTEEEMALIESFKDLILLDKSAFPEAQIRQESIHHAMGAYRLLKSIATLASIDDSTSINAYITSVVHPESIPTLRKIYTPQILLEILRKYPESKELLKRLPLWPSADPGCTIHRPATDAILPPYPNLSYTGMTVGDIFIDPAISKRYYDQLVSLNVKKMTLDEFLRNHVGVSENRRIPENKITYYESLIKKLADVCPAAFKEYPLGVDGGDKFRMLHSLYDRNEMVFEAAFRDCMKTHFLRRDFRHFPAWRNSPLIQKITESSYLACALSIQRREMELGTGDSFLIDDARIVYGYLCCDDPGMRTWSSKGWKDLAAISFAPARAGFDCTPSHRIPQMKKLLGGRNFISITEAISLKDIDVAWSQHPVLEESLSPTVLQRLQRSTLPASTVLNHVTFLSENRNTVSPSQIYGYTNDLRMAYNFLQNKLGLFRESSVPPFAKIWFNVDESEIREMDTEAFRAAWISSQNLCIGLEYDSPSLQRVHSFLGPYLPLMDYCRVKRVKAAVIPASFKADTSHTSLFLKGFQRLREEKRAFDIKLVLGDQEIPAHCVVLCAISRYWDGLFGDKMEEPRKTYRFPAGSKVRPKTVLALLEYIYTGNLPISRQSGIISEDLRDVIEQLYLSNEWQLHELKAELEVSLCKAYWIRPELVRTILKCAETVQAETLVRICKKYILDNPEIVA